MSYEPHFPLSSFLRYFVLGALDLHLYDRDGVPWINLFTIFMARDPPETTHHQCKVNWNKKLLLVLLRLFKRI